MSSCPETGVVSPLRRLLLLVSLLLLLPLAGGGSTQTSTEPFVFTRSLTAELEGTAGAPAAENVDLRIEGRAQAILAVEPISRSPIVVFVDLPLLSVDSARASLAALAERATALVERGPVTLVLGGLVNETVATATEDAEELRAALEDVLADLDDQRELAEVFALRRALLDAAEGEGWETEAVTLISDEERLLRWQWDALLHALSETPRDGDGVLLWLQDGLDPDPLRALAEVREPTARLEARTSRDLSSVLRQLGRSLAAEGWRVQTLRLEAAQEQLVPGAPEAAGILSEPSGGAVIDDEATLDATLDDLSRRLRVRYRAGGIVDDPKPVDLRIAGSSPSSWRKWMTTVAPEMRARHLARGRAEGWLDDDPRGPVVEAILLPDGLDGATLEARVVMRRDPGDDQPWTSDRIRVTLLLDSLEAIPLTRQARGGGEPLPADGSWYVQSALELPPDLDTVSLTVEDLVSGHATTAPVDFDDAPLRRDAGAVTEQLALGGSPASRAEADDPALVEIVPPRGEALTGKVTIRTLVTNDAVRSVRFYLDGELITTDERPPFRAEMELGDEVRPRSIRVVGLDLADRPIDDDEVELNAERRSGPVRLTLTPTEDAGMLVAVELAEEADEELDRLEIYRNRDLLVTLTEPPFRWQLDGSAAGPSDFVRAVAWLEDGRQLEDVAFLSGMQDRVEVNLVQVFVVVTDREDRPITDLGPEDFVLRRGKTDQSIEQFSVAEQVPLLLGLVVDTSMSMMTIMSDTQRAAAQFLATTVTPIDRAFVVDFDNRPKLAQGMTGDMLELMRGLGGLEADGVTAMYDAILFSLLQFEGERGRRALVLLSDGDDYQSRFGYARVERSVRDAALPVYAIALAGLDPERPSFRKVDLDDLTRASGGRVFYVDSMEDVDRAYDVISSELRSQYVLAFSTERPLEQEELRRIEVETSDRRHRVRFTVGQGLD